MSDAAPAVPAVTHAHLHRDAVAALTAYRPSDGSQQRLRDDYLAHLAIHPDGVAKAGPPSHLTASCLVVEQSARHVLLTLHRRAGRWFQFGGHLEASDASLWAAAAREGREESGITALTPARGTSVAAASTSTCAISPWSPTARHRCAPRSRSRWPGGRSTPYPRGHTGTSPIWCGWP